MFMKASLITVHLFKYIIYTTEIKTILVILLNVAWYGIKLPHIKIQE